MARLKHTKDLEAILRGEHITGRGFSRVRGEEDVDIDIDKEKEDPVYIYPPKTGSKLSNEEMEVNALKYMGLKYAEKDTDTDNFFRDIVRNANKGGEINMDDYKVIKEQYDKYQQRKINIQMREALSDKAGIQYFVPATSNIVKEVPDAKTMGKMGMGMGTDAQGENMNVTGVRGQPEGGFGGELGRPPNLKPRFGTAPIPFPRNMREGEDEQHFDKYIPF